MNVNVNYNMVLFDFKCAANAVCNNTEGFYNCTCTPGYTGIGNHAMVIRKDTCQIKL